MNLIQLLDEVEPRWRREYGNDPMAAAYDLGIIDEPDEPELPEVDLRDEEGAWQRYAESYEEDE